MDVGVRELRQNLSVYLDRVKAGETLRVTEHGRPVAQLAPLDEHADAYGRLVALGRLVPSSRARGIAALAAPLDLEDAAALRAEVDAGREDAS